MDSYHREQAIDPSATMNDLECSSSTPSSNASLNDSTLTNSIEPNKTPINKKKRKIFGPDNETRKKMKTKQVRRDEMFLNVMSAMVNNNQMQQGPSIPFVSSGYGSQSIRNLTEESVPSTLVPLQQQDQRYLHSLGHSTNRYGVSWQTLPMFPDKITTMFNLY